MHFIDTGTLYFTTKRLLFDGQRKTTQIPLNKIINITFYDSGMIVQKDSGKDQIFLFSGDLEMLQAITDALMTSARQ